VSSDDLDASDDDISSPIQPVPSNILTSPSTIYTPTAREKVTSLISGPNGAAAAGVGLFAFAGFSPVSKEAYEDQRRRNFDALKEDRRATLVKLKKAEAAREAEVRRNNKLRQQKCRAKKRAQEIHDGTHISQKKVHALL